MKLRNGRGSLLLSSGSEDGSDNERFEGTRSDKSNEDSDLDENKHAKDALSVLLNTTSDDSDEEEISTTQKKSRKKILNSKDDDDDDFDVKSNAMKLRKAVKSESSDDDFLPMFTRKKRQRCGILRARLSDSDSSKSSKKKPKRKTRSRASASDAAESLSSSESVKSKKRRKPKRRRIREIKDSSAEEDSDCQLVDDKLDTEDSPNKKGRKNIRKLIKDSKLHSDTRQAAREEEERRKRVVNLQKKYNEVVVVGSGDRAAPITTKLVLATNPETDEPLLEVHPKLIPKLKPHQVDGVKFMWECTCETLERLKTHPGSGCILGHCMGLGKTLQVITYLHTLMTNEETGIKACLVVCPLNTVHNWFNEFKHWLRDTRDDDDNEPIEVTELTTVKNNYNRAYALKNWIEDGGVMILGYDMFRNLTNEKAKRLTKSQRAIFQESLINPGPDIVVCDEGHLLKNAKTAIAKAMDGVRTARRIILTGTPLQNNLAEYHCMVSFVKPNLLGTMTEFQNRFMNPISNGQHADSTQSDVRLMKRRAHILHNLLDGCVQRKDYSVLVPFLPPKQEYVISIKLTEVQIKLYAYYLEHFARKTVKSTLFSDFQVLSRIWTHPWLLRLAQIRAQNKATYDSESSFIDDDEDTKSSANFSCASDEPSTSKGRKDGDNSGDEEIIKEWKSNRRGGDGKNEQPAELIELDSVPKDEWWTEFVSQDDSAKVELGGKIVILFDILKECEVIGDKVLVFSQSLLSLDLLEDMLQRCGTCASVEEKSWLHGYDYFRMDGSTSAELRSRYTRLFNDEENYKARLFLISTKAGSLGINLVTANRVVIFDASWNPTHDVQSIFRVYRFGQKKPVYIYRFLAQGTMEEKIYDRQVTKQSLSIRVLDEQQVDRHFNFADLQELYSFEPDSVSKRPTPLLPKDRLLAELLLRHKEVIVNYHEHDSLLVNVQEEELSEEDRRAAWVEYDAERKGLATEAGGGGLAGGLKLDLPKIIEDIQQKHPGLTIDELQEKLQETIKMVAEAKRKAMLVMQQQQQQQRMLMLQRQYQQQQMQQQQQQKEQQEWLSQMYRSQKGNMQFPLGVAKMNPSETGATNLSAVQRQMINLQKTLASSHPAASGPNESSIETIE